MIVERFLCLRRLAGLGGAEQAVVFLFRFGHDGSSMVVTMADAERVLDTASKTRLCRRDPELLLEVFMENCGAGECGHGASILLPRIGAGGAGAEGAGGTVERCGWMREGLVCILYCYLRAVVS